jgi:hypothetical protein
MFGNEQLQIPLVAQHNIIPPLAKVMLYVPDGRPFDERVRIVPVVRGAILRVTPQ